MNHNLVTIGLLSYQRTDLLVETLECINNTSISLDLIIVNNNEHIDIIDEIKEVITNPLISFQYIWHKRNYGVAIGRNKIIEQLKTEYLIMFDDDVYIPNIDKIIRNTINAFEQEKDLGGLAFHLKDIKTNKENRYEIPHKNKKINPNKDYYTYLMIGAGHALRKSALDVAGGYPEDFGLYGMEEIDLSFRMIKFNYKIKYIAENIVFHKKSPDGRHSNNNVEYLYYVNRSKIAKNYFGKKQFILTFLVRGTYFLYKTRNFKLLGDAVYEIYRYKGTGLKYSEENYQYINKVKGFINW